MMVTSPRSFAPLAVTVRTSPAAMGALCVIDGSSPCYGLVGHAGYGVGDCRGYVLQDQCSRTATRPALHYDVKNLEPERGGDGLECRTGGVCGHVIADNHGGILPCCLPLELRV
jgi:hypothetical protein